ncbi:MAG: flagellar basal body-associated FliL family protein [Betaproteobacteria bacterium]|nr:flagellar basal body-associated FliL family protein [Betaproteobacteria bacterium]
MSAASPPADSPPAKKGSKKGLLIAIACVVAALAAAGGGAAWYLSRAQGDEAEPAKGAAKTGAKADGKQAKAKERKPGVFLPLDTFTVNLQGPGREHFLQVGLVLEVADAPASDAVKQLMPVIRSQVLLLLAAKNAEELATPDGKAALATEVLAKIRQPLPATPPLAGIEAVHYAGFIIQ